MCASGMGMDFAVAGINHQPFVVGLINQAFEQRFPCAAVAPAGKATVGILPAAVVRWQVAPRSACTQDPEYRIDEATIVLSYTAPLSCSSRQVRLNQYPVFIG